MTFKVHRDISEIPNKWSFIIVSGSGKWYNSNEIGQNNDSNFYVSRIDA